MRSRGSQGATKSAGWTSAPWWISLIADPLLGRVFYGEHSLEPGSSDDSPGYVDAADLADLADWLRSLTAEDLAREFDGPGMERVQAYRMRPWDPDRPRDMPDRWRSDVAHEFLDFREFLIGAVERRAFIVSRLG